jgi:PTH1 family peptidyl-tRNA hydrolase
MGLFQNRPETTEQVPLYTLGANKTVLIIGLGNPGKEYKATRHNIGFEILDEFAKTNDFGAWISKKDLKVEVCIPFGQLRTRLGGSDAGHNGVKSLIQHTGDDFGRLRIGVGSDVSKRADAADFVLGKFTKAEQAALPQIIKEANAIITEYIFGGSLPNDTRTIL